MSLPPDLVIFDCDGVLVDSEPVTNSVIMQNLLSYGLSVPLEDITSLFVGGTMAGVQAQARKMGARLPDIWIDEIYGQLFDALSERCAPIPGAIEVLDRLDHAGIGYAIGSNGPHAKMEITLTKCGLKDRLRGRIFSREDVAHPKPAPDVYLHAAKCCGVSPDRCVVIEDSPSGAQAGIAAGMPTFGLAPLGEDQRLHSICTDVFSDMADLPSLLGL